MSRTVAEKLLIRPGSEVLIADAGLEQRALLEPLPEGAIVVDGVERSTADVAVLFAADHASLDRLLDDALPHLSGARATWIAYPKGNRVDINRDSIWRIAEEIGWTLVANVSLGDIWSAVRMRPAG